MADEASETKRSPRRAKFPAKLRDMVRKHPDVLRWNQSERTLIIEDRTRLSKITTGIKWSSFKRQLLRYGFYKHDWRTGVPGIVFANCDPRVVTIDDLAGLVRAAKPQNMQETTRAQLRRVRENDELRNLQRKLRDEDGEPTLQRNTSIILEAVEYLETCTIIDIQFLGTLPEVPMLGPPLREYSLAATPIPRLLRNPALQHPGIANSLP